MKITECQYMIAVVRNVIALNNEYLLVMSEFSEVANFTNIGVESRKIGVFLCAALSEEMFVIDLEQIERKCFRMPYWDPVHPNIQDEPISGKFVVAAFLHPN